MHRAHRTPRLLAVPVAFAALAVLAGLLGACRSSRPVDGASASVGAGAAPSTAAPAVTTVPAAPTTTTTTAVRAGDGGGSVVIAAGGEIRVNGSVIDGSGRGPVTAAGSIVGSGIVVTEARPVTGFRAVDLRAFGRVDIDLADHDSVEVEADDNVVGLVRTEVIDGRLLVAMADGTSLRNATLRIRIGAVALDDVVVDGSSDVEIRGLAAPRFDLVLAGSGDAGVSGAVDDLLVDVEGSGDVRAAELVAQRARVQLTGSGDVAVQAVQSLDAAIAGSGDVTYRGSPGSITRTVSGSGDIEAA
jgi:hypothetical protein